MTTTHSTSPFLDYAAQLREFIGHQSSNGSRGGNKTGELEFNRLALLLFGLQLAHNAPYRQFCHSRKVAIKDTKDWTQIPAMPTPGFKELELTCLEPHRRTTVFPSSGTTGQQPSRHFHSADSLSLYEASLLPWFRANLLPVANGAKPHAFEIPGREETTWLFLTPSHGHSRHSSLVHMFESVRHEFGSAASHFTGSVNNDGTWDLDLNATVSALRDAIVKKRPVILCGTAFTFVHLLDHLDQANLFLRLPPGSRALETGGYKGRSRILPKAELHALITDLLGIPASHIVCEYGMSELSSQAYDSVAGKATAGGRVFHFPPWARAQIVSPETGREVGEGETGLIRIFDLANVYSVMAIQTEDLGVRRGEGFELLGRAAMAEPRGCSLRSV
ncbi:MAG: putative acyl protein synthase/acyl-CoA reductase-like protein [Pedosphaera sp.]|nr:putative acyl protein synthase/acyl-CoA reductase-like protein [Pedosphaera sp.]